MYLDILHKINIFACDCGDDEYEDEIFLEYESSSDIIKQYKKIADGKMNNYQKFKTLGIIQFTGKNDDIKNSKCLMCLDNPPDLIKLN